MSFFVFISMRMHEDSLAQAYAHTWGNAQFWDDPIIVAKLQRRWRRLLSNKQGCKHDMFPFFNQKLGSAKFNGEQNVFMPVSDSGKRGPYCMGSSNP